MSTTTPPLPGPNLRRAWLAVGSLAAVAVLGFGTVKAVDVVAHEERDQVDVVPAEGLSTLVVSVDRGSVEVVGSQRDDVELTARISDSLRPTSYHHQVVDGELRVTGRCPSGPVDTWCRTTVRVAVPAGFDVTVRSDGGVSVRGVDGSVDAGSENGSVAVTDVGGDLRLRSENGSVRGSELRSTRVDAASENGRVRLVLLEEPRRVVARSENGSVEVVIPPGDALYRVSASSDNRSTTNDVRTDPTSDRSIEAHSDNGSATVRYLR